MRTRFLRVFLWIQPLHLIDNRCFCSGMSQAKKVTIFRSRLDESDADPDSSIVNGRWKECQLRDLTSVCPNPKQRRHQCGEHSRRLCIRLRHYHNGFFFLAGSHMIQMCPKLSCFLMFKNVKIMRNCRERKGLLNYTTYDTPLFSLGITF